MGKMEEIKAAQDQFAELIQSEFERIEWMKKNNEVTEFSGLDQIVIGILPGDGNAMDSTIQSFSDILEIR